MTDIKKERFHPLADVACIVYGSVYKIDTLM